MAKKASKKTAKKTEKKTEKKTVKVVQLSLVAQLREQGAPAGPIGSVRKAGLDARHYNPGAGGKVNYGR